MKRNNSRYLFIIFNILALSSCLVSNPDNNFDYLDEESGCLSYFWESFGVEYPKNNIDKNNDFNIFVTAGNLYYKNNKKIYDDLYEEVYFFINDFNLNNIYKLNIDPLEFASQDWNLNYVNNLKYDDYKHKFEINLHKLIPENYDNFIYIGFKLFNNQDGNSVDYHFRYKFTNIIYQNMIRDQDYINNNNNLV